MSIIDRCAESFRPVDLGEAFECLDIIVPDKFKGWSEEDFVSRTHHGIGRFIRNNWGLWAQEGNFYDLLRGMGLRHADDMSGLILTSWFRSRKGKDLRIEEQVSHYQFSKRQWQGVLRYLKQEFEPWLV